MKKELLEIIENNARLTDKDIAVMLSKEEGDIKKMITELEKERKKYGFKLKLPSTSKIVLAITFLMCLQIMFFCEYAMLTSGDFSALYVLIGAPVTLVPIALGYMVKSKAENTSGGIVYEQAMHDMRANTCEESNLEDPMC